MERAPRQMAFGAPTRSAAGRARPARRRTHAACTVLADALGVGSPLRARASPPHIRPRLPESRPRPHRDLPREPLPQAGREDMRPTHHRPLARRSPGIQSSKLLQTARPPNASQRSRWDSGTVLSGDNDASIVPGATPTPHATPSGAVPPNRPPSRPHEPLDTSSPSRSEARPPPGHRDRRHRAPLTGIRPALEPLSTGGDQSLRMESGSGVAIGGATRRRAERASAMVGNAASYSSDSTCLAAAGVTSAPSVRAFASSISPGPRPALTQAKPCVGWSVSRRRREPGQEHFGSSERTQSRSLRYRLATRNTRRVAPARCRRRPIARHPPPARRLS